MVHDNSKSELRLIGLSKSFSDKKVLENVNYKFEQGKIYSIIGRNGAGKTTLFNLINEELKRDEGEVKFYDGEILREIKYEDIGVVSSSPVLPEFLTGYEFIRYFLEFKYNTKEISEDEIKKYFQLIKINSEDQHKLIKQYSFGMKNKIQLLLSLIKNPKIILLDEPLSSFDIIVSHDIKELLIEMKKDHIIILTTHIMQLAQDISDEIVLLKNGNLKGSLDLDIKGDDFEEYIIKELSGE